MSDKPWYYAFNNQPQGPVEQAVIQKLVGEGSLNGQTLVWQEGMQDWAALQATPLQTLLPVPVAAAAPPPVPSPAVPAQDGRSKIIAMAEGLAGGWPDELPRGALDGVDLDKLLAKLESYQNMAHPGFSFGTPSKPDYRMVNGKIARASYAPDDIKIVTTARMLSGGTISPTDFERIGRMTFNVIEHYGGTRLVKFLFLLPMARKNTEAVVRGEKAIVVIEYMLIEIYKGIENVLFEIYDELGNGETFDDGRVNRKLLSIVEAAKRS